MREEFYTPRIEPECKARYGEWCRKAKREYLVWKQQ